MTTEKKTKMNVLDVGHIHMETLLMHNNYQENVSAACGRCSAGAQRSAQSGDQQIWSPDLVSGRSSIKMMLKLLLMLKL